MHIYYSLILVNILILVYRRSSIYISFLTGGMEYLLGYYSANMKMQVCMHEAELRVETQAKGI